MGTQMTFADAEAAGQEEDDRVPAAHTPGAVLAGPVGRGDRGRLPRLGPRGGRVVAG